MAPRSFEPIRRGLATTTTLIALVLAGCVNDGPPQVSGPLYGEPSGLTLDEGEQLDSFELSITLNFAANLTAGVDPRRIDEGRLEAPANVSRGRVTATWTPASPTAERLRLDLRDDSFGSGKARIVASASGQSPLVFDVEEAPPGDWYFVGGAVEGQIAVRQRVDLIVEMVHRAP